jgi:hypothetical protein
MTQTARVTWALIIVAATVLITWDVKVALNDVSGDTISELLLEMAYRNPVLPFAFGVLMGHLFWPQEKGQ